MLSLDRCVMERDDSKSIVPVIVRDETMSLTQTYRYDMSDIAANAYVEIEKERTKAAVAVAEARYATPARWSAGALVLVVLLTVAGIVYVCTLGLSDVQLAIAVVTIGGGGAGTALILRKVLLNNLTPSAG